ncbi:MAG: hypothetical protein IIW08_00275, partial [Clostridia bacterium]|nr:hypothetical protein [Clostridia bacterium]
MTIRKALPSDRAAIFALWNASCEKNEVVYKPLTEERFHALFEANPHYDGEYDFIAEENGEAIGFVSGAEKKIFLPGETRENTPGFITAIFVKDGKRKEGVGKA